MHVTFVQVLVRGCNVRPLVYRHRIVELQILDYGYSSRIPPKWGNAQKLSTDLEADDNPQGVWKLKRMALLKRHPWLHYY